MTTNRAALIMLLVGVVGFCLSTASYSASRKARWKITKPIVWYFAGPGYFNYVNDLTVSQLVAGGWNLGWAYSRDELDVYHRHGMKALAAIENMNMSDPAQVKIVDEKLKWSDHPATYGYWICDEPAPDKFPNIGKVVDYLRQHDPSKPAVINLLPVIGVADGDVVGAYRGNLKKFMDAVEPDILSFDFYPFMAAGDGIYYFLNLMLMREAALKADIPFVNISQAIAHENIGYRWPNEPEMRWLAYTTIAYGGQGISWYIYNDMLDKPELSGFFKDTPDSKLPNDRYWWTSRINRDFESIVAELMPYKSQAVYHYGPHAKLGDLDDERWKFLKNDITKGEAEYWARLVEKHIPYGGVELPSKSPYSFDKYHDLLISCFGKSKSNISHIFVVNLNYKNPIATTITGPADIDIFHSPDSTWASSPRGNQAALELPAGGGVLLRFRNK